MTENYNGLARYRTFFTQNLLCRKSPASPYAPRWTHTLVYWGYWLWRCVYYSEAYLCLFCVVLLNASWLLSQNHSNWLYNICWRSRINYITLFLCVCVWVVKLLHDLFPSLLVHKCTQFEVDIEKSSRSIRSNMAKMCSLCDPNWPDGNMSFMKSCCNVFCMLKNHQKTHLLIT